MSDSRFNLLVYACLIGLLLVGFHLRGFRLDEFPPGISRDEATNVVDGAILSRSGRLPLFQDHEEPEPIKRVYGALTSIFFGNSVWAFRYTSALLGMLAMAAVFWASQRCFATRPRRVRLLIGLLAMASLATALGHIAINRSIYRAVLLVFFAALANWLHLSRAKAPPAAAITSLAAIALRLAATPTPLGSRCPWLICLLPSIWQSCTGACWRRWLAGSDCDRRSAANAVDPANRLSIVDTA